MELGYASTEICICLTSLQPIVLDQHLSHIELHWDHESIEHLTIGQEDDPS